MVDAAVCHLDLFGEFVGFGKCAVRPNDAVQAGGQLGSDVFGELRQTVLASAGHHDGGACLQEGAHDAFPDVASAAGYDRYAVDCGW